MTYIMSNPTISIVANFYKPAKYIPKLINSVLNQTFNDWELICVNDCSPQNDAEIISEFSNNPKANNRIRLINNQTNLGISKAKKIGIDNAKGSYITFIDGDDWFEPQALERLVKPALKYDLDYVQMNSRRAYPLGAKKTMTNIVHEYNHIINSKELIDKYFVSFFGINLIGVAYWGKLFKTEIVRNSEFQFQNYPIGEDLLFNVHIFPLIQSAMFIDYVGYNWRFGGITSSETSINKCRQMILDFIDIYRIKKQCADKLNYTKAYIPMHIELKNILKGNFSALAKFSQNDCKSLEIKKFIADILSIDDYTLNISKLLSNDKYKNDKFIIAISQKDIDTIYNICNAIYKQNWKHRLIKQTLRLLNF